MTEIAKEQEQEIMPASHSKDEVEIPRNLRELFDKARKDGVKESVVKKIEQDVRLEILAGEATKESIYGFEAMVEDLIDRKKMDVKESEEDEILSRRLRDHEFAGLLRKAEDGGELDENEINTLQAVYNRRGLGKTLQNVEKNDTVVTVLSPVSENLAIKNLNDKVFGQQVTDKIILKSRLILERAFLKRLHEAGVEMQAGKVILDQNYKTGVFKIPENPNLKIDEMMNEVCEELDIKMNLYLGKLVETEKASHPDKSKVYDEFYENIRAEGYRASFGTIKVDTETDPTVEDKVLAMERSLQMSREISLANTKESKQYGAEYSGEEVMKKISEQVEAAKEMYEKQNELVYLDEKGGERSVQLFAKMAGSLVLDRNLLRRIRKKDKMVPGAGYEEIFEKINKYVAGLNILDLVKPFTSEEFDQIAKSSEEDKKILEGIKNKDKAAIETAAKTLKREVRDEQFTSEAVFHSQSSQIKDCAYLSLDVLDVGVDQLLDYEQLMQKVVNGKIDLTEAQKVAGDDMTKKLRGMREKVFGLLEKSGVVETNSPALGLVGGDELVLAVDLQKISESDLEKLVFDIKESTNSRVVKTVLSEVKRNNPDNADVQNRMEKHLGSLKKAELGTKKAKEIETKLRELGLRANASVPVDNEVGKDELKMVNLFIESLSRFVIEEDGEDFMVKVGVDQKPERPDDIIKKIEPYINIVKKYEKS